MIADKIGVFGCIPIRHKVYDTIINILVHQMPSAVFTDVDARIYDTVNNAVCDIRFLVEDSLNDII